jgi:tungstate transport system substrate-binding protein
VAPSSLAKREETGQGMGATLLVADQRQTYTLTDRGTWLAFKDETNLVPLLEGDPRLRNIYHAYIVNPGRHPTAKRAEASRFVRFLVDPAVQGWIGTFGTAKYGQALFVPDAEGAAASSSR